MTDTVPDSEGAEMRDRSPFLLGTLIAVAVAACGGPTPETATSSPPPSAEPSAGEPSPTAAAAANPAPYVEGQPYEPAFDPASFGGPVDNPWFPLAPGTTWVYRGGGERIVTTVTRRTRDILGIQAVVVRDRAFEGGELIEDTFDWYAQDAAGNVWYLGEATEELEGGKVVSTAGSWEAGVDGALPGVIMLADPVVDTSDRQEFYAGEAEDVAKVIVLDEPVEVPTGSWVETVTTEDWTPLEPDVTEHKTYAAGVGLAREEIVRGGKGVVRLVEIRTGG